MRWSWGRSPERPCADALPGATRTVQMQDEPASQQRRWSVPGGPGGDAPAHGAEAPHLAWMVRLLEERRTEALNRGH